MKSALVVIPTTGSPELLDAIRSVQSQTYPNLDLLIVVDGHQFSTRTDELLHADGIDLSRLFRLDLPFNTGGNGFYGHRIMAGISHLINHDYVLFLDQDNWFNSDHVESLVMRCANDGWDWAYSLRKIYSKNKEYVCDDNCESLGKWEITAAAPGNHLIDTSSYCFSVPFLTQVGHIWNFGWGADRRFYTMLKDHVKHTNYGCSGKYSLNYRLGGNEGSVKPEFFIHGNAISIGQYGNTFPWSS